MCGRFVRHRNVYELTRLLSTAWEGPEPEPNYNVAPGTPIVIVRTHEGQPAEITHSLWGFRPSWADANAPTPINAKAETVATSRYFRNAFAHHRALIPADGWYEWRVEDGRKQPYYIRRKDGEVLMFAAIWTPMAEGTASSCAIITQPPQPAIAHIHDRMPVVLDPSCWQDWLDPELTDREAIRQIARPLPRGLLEAYPVSTTVNSVRNNAPELIERI